MKKIKELNNHGFVLAETLVVSVFLVVIFTMIYVNYYPIIGEYEKRENYDDVDSEYAAYWIKTLIEDANYTISPEKKTSLNSNQYFQFECSDFPENSTQRSLCINLVKAFEIDGCDNEGKNCKIYVTKYKIGPDSENSFKKTVESSENKIFPSKFKDYIAYLPDYINESTDGADYRVFIIIHHTKDYNNYQTYSNIEVKKEW